MRLSSLIAVAVISVVIYWVTGGGSLFWAMGTNGELPETIVPANATFVGNEQSNPFVD